ncbi:DUF2147 domain-containing protein [Formosa algae]|uniref:Uncharacterized protein (DUF2147 family) n=1 Tax=Formosa algae TaxID=225843 RepID=A0A9X0YL67_9FLAO|nr:DUF2147 domain-containing protein [Formosa algae]MBP1840639.1 uncharacterized protein (DUF2147 family) [Formosa algae]MDQ0335948.1 uncharacterized protein (DUF2147 family) [Formosa algae]OEI81158.1 hypothetical protein AST99_05730 [Formosa algae]
MKHLFLFFLISMSITVSAQNIVGQWETYDDKTNEKKALIEISETNDVYSAKIIDKFVGDKDSVCEKCEGEKKNHPMIGLVIIEDIKKDGDEYSDGTILDPESGDVYSCYLKLVNANKLKVRGFLGVSLFGRTQYWIRKQ